MSEIKLEKLDDNRWLLPRTGAMRVPGIIYANEKISGLLTRDESAKQVANVAHLPGIVDFSLAMPDIHWGYGFPIGGVAAFDMDDGVVSPGGVGYDINCGCRLLATELTLHDIKDNVKDLTTALYRRIPTGVGSTGYVRLSEKSAGRRCGMGDQSRFWIGPGPGNHRRRGMHRRGGSGAGFRARPRAGKAAVGHTGFRQSLSGN
jgi:tRNA-splicing ligase RtcB